MSNPQIDPEDVLECARSIRLELPELLGADAEPFDQQLADLLAQANSGQPTDQQIVDLLKSNDRTRSRAGEMLSKPATAKGGDYQRLPGKSEGQKTVKYICPVGNDFTRRLRQGEEIPICRTHKVALVPAAEPANEG